MTKRVVGYVVKDPEGHYLVATDCITWSARRVDALVFGLRRYAILAARRRFGNTRVVRLVRRRKGE